MAEVANRISEKGKGENDSQELAVGDWELDSRSGIRVV
jgi:hypothetical protein